MANTNGVSRVQEYNMADFENYETFGPNMTRDETHDWFVKKLARTPGHEDVYAVAKEFYHLGAFSRSLSCLQYYITLQGASNIGRHLLGYCYLNLGDSERALREFKKAVRAYDTHCARLTDGIPLWRERASARVRGSTRFPSLLRLFSFAPPCKLLSKANDRISGSPPRQLNTPQTTRGERKGPKVLVVGLSGSGRTTLLKQMQLIYAACFTPAQLADFRIEILEYLVRGFQRLSADHHASASGTHDCKFYCEQIDGFTLPLRPPREATGGKSSVRLPMYMVNAMHELARQPEILALISPGCELDYFVHRLDRVLDIGMRTRALTLLAGYTPTTDDVLMVKSQTRGIPDDGRDFLRKHRFVIENVRHCFFDLQAGVDPVAITAPRFEAILFTADMACFDATDGDGVNRLVKTLDLFKRVLCAPMYRDTHVILLLNKKDVFERKIRAGKRLEEFFPDFKFDPALLEVVDDTTTTRTRKSTPSRVSTTSPWPQTGSPARARSSGGQDTGPPPDLETMYVRQSAGYIREMFLACTQGVFDIPNRLMNTTPPPEGHGHGARDERMRIWSLYTNSASTREMRGVLSRVKDIVIKLSLEACGLFR
ncbi:MAG: hypothetical protein SGCHY_004622 [Lobulomycetales sp.]